MKIAMSNNELLGGEAAHQHLCQPHRKSIVAHRSNAAADADTRLFQPRRLCTPYEITRLTRRRRPADTRWLRDIKTASRESNVNRRGGEDKFKKRREFKDRQVHANLTATLTATLLLDLGRLHPLYERIIWYTHIYHTWWSRNMKEILKNYQNLPQ